MGKDTIYRQDALNEIQRFLGYLDQDMINRIKIGIGRLPSSEPKLDKNDMPEHGGSGKFREKTGETEAMEMVKNMETIEPRPKGEWENPTVMAIKWKCSVCKNTAVSLVGKSPSYNFCPKCGADMRQRKEEQDETD